MCDERCGGNDGAIEDHRGTPCRRTEQQSHHGGDVGTTDGGKQLERGALVRLAATHRIAHGSRLAHPGRVVDPGAATHDREEIGGGEETGDGCRGGGVADAHVADDEEVGSRVDLLVSKGHAEAEGTPRLIEGHRVLAVDRSAGATDTAGGHARIEVVGVVRGGVDADIDDADVGAYLAREGVGGSALGEEGAHHLSGHLGGIGGGAGRPSDAMVAGDDEQHGSLGWCRGALAAHGGPPGAEILQAPQGALGLGQRTPPGSGGLRGSAIGPVDAGDDLGDDVIRPAVISTRVISHGALRSRGRARRP